MKHILFIILTFPFLLSAQEYVAFFDAVMDIEKTIENKPINRSIVPFSIKEGMILVDAYVNQTKGKYIIDTGAPTLVLNQQPSDIPTVGRGISQELKTNHITVDQFNWSNIQKTAVAAFQVDISHLEANSDTPIAGIIGYDILREIELSVNYQTKTVRINPLKDTAKNPSKAVAIIPFKMQGHLPVIKVKVGNKKLRLALDTGSESNILDSRFLEKINTAQLGNVRQGELQGVDQQIKEVNIASIQETAIQDINLSNMDYLFTDLSHLKSESGLYIDGLLGYPFFKQGEISINYAERKIYVWSLEE